MQITLGPIMRRIDLEDADVPYVPFCGLQAGLHARQLAPQGCSSSAESAASSGLAEAGELLLPASSRSCAALRALTVQGMGMALAWPHLLDTC